MSIKILSWNVMGSTWPPIEKVHGSGKVRKIIYPRITAQILNHQPDVICLQEAKEYNQLGLNEFLSYSEYTIIDKSIIKDNKWNQLILATRGKVINSGEIILENKPEIINTKKIISPVPSECIFVDTIVNNGLVRIYNCHLRIRDQGISGRLYLLDQILRNAKEFNGDAIICGDFNTIIPEAGMKRKIVDILHKQPKDSQIVNGSIFQDSEKYCFNDKIKSFGFKDLLPLETPTFGIPWVNWNFFNLKLDWFIVKNLNGTIRLGKLITDHRPILAEIMYN